MNATPNYYVMPVPVKGASTATPAEKSATMYGSNRAQRRKAAKMQRRKQAKGA